ncbi:MAG: tetratricopeptide repeat protein [Bacteroidia bacterium]
MSKQTENDLLNVEETLSKWEQKIEENKKSYSIILGAIVAVVAIYFAWTKLYVAPKEAEAQSEMFRAERYFAQDSLDKAMFGDGNYLGFNDIIENYGVTKSANLATYYMGICYLKKGEYENAIKYLKDFDANDQIVAPIALGAIGDAYLELGNNEEAIEYYLKAASASENKFTTPIYLMRAGMTMELTGKYKEAVEVYKKIKTDYNETAEGREVEKYLARAEAMLNS